MNKTSKSVLSRLLVSRSGEQDRRTPLAIFKELNKEFEFELDPCTSCSKQNNLRAPYFFTKEQDGLKQSWGSYRSVFVNPPFRDMSKWVDKILFELEKCNDELTIVLLTPSKTETRWWHKLLGSKFLSEIRFQKGRVTFEGHKNPFIIGITFFILKNKGDVDE